MRAPVPTSAELVNTLKHSTLPSVITEGYEDYLVFRHLEEQLSCRGISFLPAGGKPAVLEIFAHRGEFSHIRTAFIVDKDLWLFSGTPNEYVDNTLIQTDGYSIENDLYRDGDLEQLLLANERARFTQDRDALCEWFSFAVKCNAEGRQIAIDLHPNQLLLGSGTLNPEILANDYEPCPIISPKIKSEYAKYLRGKTLFHLLIKYLSAPGRGSRHNARALMEYAAVKHGPFTAAIQESLETLFA